MAAKKDFKWTDDESELLLNVTLEYKVKKIAENVDWESVKSKYDDILVLMQAEMPSSSVEKPARDYPHLRSEMTKAILSTKLKNIRQKFRQAVDSGRRSGHGRVVLLYFELCEAVWGGSPATEQLDTGLESTDLDQICPHSPKSLPDLGGTVANNESNNSVESHNDDTPVDESTVHARRNLLDKQLTEHRQSKLKRKLPVDMQLLACAQEELAMKKQLIEHMEKAEERYQDNMAMLSSSMEHLTNSITEGFTLLRHIMNPPRPPLPDSYYSPY